MAHHSILPIFGIALEWLLPVLLRRDAFWKKLGKNFGRIVPLNNSFEEASALPNSTAGSSYALRRQMVCQSSASTLQNTAFWQSACAPFAHAPGLLRHLLAFPLAQIFFVTTGKNDCCDRKNYYLKTTQLLTLFAPLVGGDPVKPKANAL